MLKPCEKPLKMLKLEALSRRLSPNHPKQEKIRNDFRKIDTGFNGERSIGNELKDLSKEYQVLHDLRLSNDGSRYFQMDFLIITRNVCIIIEVKNFAGMLYFDRTYPQLIRTKDGQEQAYLDPLIQVDVQKSRLSDWLAFHKFPALPIETLIANANSNTIIRTTPGFTPIFKRITGKETLISKIHTLEEKYPSEQLTQRQRNRLSNTMMLTNTPHNQDILEWYQIDEQDLLKSVQCPKCSTLHMQYHWGKWSCGQCSYASKDAHIQTLRDFALLIKPKITNKQARLFLQIDSIDIMQRMLSALGLPYSGQFKNRAYSLEGLIHE
ncbi:NERD domain-containing protein [Peribacillus sp. NJ4]|uniref:NERD domain-containing protein n=1 Tax=Peribacillus sp. NJ4 TaxID=3055862 RepID=UPI0025A14DFB|nr:NERD domain-containing protein [Peribacillus sp. NJ4]MDM5211517.1 NERD domain-containing protein [Peribacillus sp. NJ4]